MTLGLLASGNLGKTILVFLIEKDYSIDFVFTDKNSIDIINICNENRIDLFIGNPRNNRCIEFIHNRKIDVLISINYLFIIEKELINLPSKIAFNIHGSLLPKYRGRTPHVWAIINNETITGITAHIMNEECDSGDIIHQIKVPIDRADTGATLLEKYKKLYIQMVIYVLDNIEKGNIILKHQNDSFATYFGKRTPEDGQINWNWQKERIYNWVRAQSFPYPGAFTMLKGQKIVVDKISYSEYGFNSNMPNGLILKNKPLILVKTPNGVVELTKIRNNQIVTINTNDKFESPCK
jgi:methionyl-tRNA formyltransferase